jgi:hypothetical protein
MPIPILIFAENLAMATDGVPKPRPIHLDIASSVHNAPEKVSQTADIDAMCAVISKAGAAIFGSRIFERQRSRGALAPGFVMNSQVGVAARTQGRKQHKQ